MDKKLTSTIECKDLSGEDVTFEGWANVAVVDDAGDLMKFDNVDLRRFKKNPILLFNHDRDLPIGRALDARIEEKGLWIKGRISSSKDPFISYVRDLVKEGILKTLSIGFRTRKESMNASGVNEIMDWVLDEISVVTLPCNMEAEFALAKSLAEKHGVTDYEKFFQGEIKVQPEETTTEGEGTKETCEDQKPAEGEQTPEDKAGESIQECISRKIPKLIEEGKDREQAIAIALSMCSQEGKCNIEALTKEETDALFAHAKQIATPMTQEVPDLATQFSPTVDLLKAQLGMLGEILGALRGISSQVEALAKIEDSGENSEVTPPTPTTPPVEVQTGTPSEDMMKALDLSKRIAEIANRIASL